MDNKYIIIAALISLVGAFFEPSSKYEIKKKSTESHLEHDAEICIDSLRNVNDSLIESLRMENRVLKDINERLRKRQQRHK